MGWFGAGYPHKPQWNGIWWVASLAELGSTEGVIRALQDDSSEAKVDLQDALAAALEAGDYQAAVNAASPLTAKKTAEGGGGGSSEGTRRRRQTDRLAGQRRSRVPSLGFRVCLATCTPGTPNSLASTNQSPLVVGCRTAARRNSFVTRPPAKKKD